jgi:prophage antirepressor-like protein
MENQQLTCSSQNLLSRVFEGQDVRIAIADQTGEPWFVLRDVLGAMGSSTKLSDAKVSIEQGLGKGEVVDLPLQTAGGTQDTTIISEAAATFLIARSNTEKGRKLNRWIHSEVLPSIRKTGSYGMPGVSLEELEARILARVMEQVKPLLLEAPKRKKSQPKEFLELTVLSHRYKLAHHLRNFWHTGLPTYEDLAKQILKDAGLITLVLDGEPIPTEAARGCYRINGKGRFKTVKWESESFKEAMTKVIGPWEMEQ